jgi:hypothetical protein
MLHLQNLAVMQGGFQEAVKQIRASLGLAPERLAYTCRKRSIVEQKKKKESVRAHTYYQSYNGASNCHATKVVTEIALRGFP